VGRRAGSELIAGRRLGVVTFGHSGVSTADREAVLAAATSLGTGGAEIVILEIVADAIELDCGIIVMGSRGRCDLAGLVVGSTAHKVIQLTDRPVLIVR